VVRCPLPARHTGARVASVAGGDGRTDAARGSWWKQLECTLTMCCVHMQHVAATRAGDARPCGARGHMWCDCWRRVVVRTASIRATSRRAPFTRHTMCTSGACCMLYLPTRWQRQPVCGCASIHPSILEADTARSGTAGKDVAPHVRQCCVRDHCLRSGHACSHTALHRAYNASDESLPKQRLPRALAIVSDGSIIYICAPIQHHRGSHTSVINENYRRAKLHWTQPFVPQTRVEKHCGGGRPGFVNYTVTYNTLKELQLHGGCRIRSWHVHSECRR